MRVDEKRKKRIRILHVDDETLFLESAKTFLERLNVNFSVDTATSAEAGLELLKASKYDAVISDYKMPGMDGLEFLQHLRVSGNTVPFIILTGKGREEVAMEALNKGANHYLQKGGDVKSLYETLAHVIREEVGEKRTEGKLAEIEKERQVILDSVPAMIFRVDEDSKFVYANERLANACGMIPEDFIGKTTREIFPEEADAYIASDKEVVRSGRPMIGLIGRFCTPKGIRWVRCGKVPVKDADGNVASIIGFAVDITEQKQVEGALRFQSEVVANLTVGVAVIRAADGVIVYANPRFEEMFGYDSAELAEMNSSGLYAPTNGKSAEEIQEEIATALDNYSVWSGEIQTAKRDGTIFWCRVGISASGTPQVGTVWIAVYDDITGQKCAEETLRASAQQWQTSFDALSESVCLLDLEGRILRCNKAMTDLLGKPSSEIIGGTCWELVHSTSEPIEGCPIVRMRETLRRESRVLPVADRWFDVSTYPVLGDDGRLVGVVHIMSDIPEWKRAEEALKESE